MRFYPEPRDRLGVASAGRCTPTSAGFAIDVITAAQATSVYDGLATYTNQKIGFDLSLILSASGDWDVSDFTCEFGTCTLDLDVVLQDAASVMPGEPFALETTLVTETIMAGARETFGESDFFNTGDFSLSSDTPGASFVFVPEPATASLLVAGLLAASASGRRR